MISQKNEIYANFQCITWNLNSIVASQSYVMTYTLSFDTL